MILKVLVVEDNLSLNKSIVNLLKRENYSAFGAVSLKEAKEAFIKEKPHIVLLDLMLPQGTSYDLIPYFRKNNDCRILILTALDDKESKQSCYKNGADDFITKPFDLDELLLKINAIKRRIHVNLKECHIGDITFNLDTNTLSCNEKSIVIQPSQIKFLKMIYDKHLDDNYVDKAEAFRGISSDINEAGRLQTLVARLRKNLSFIGSEQIDIETIYGKGYKMIVGQNKRRG